MATGLGMGAGVGKATGLGVGAGAGAGVGAPARRARYNRAVSCAVRALDLKERAAARDAAEMDLAMSLGIWVHEMMKICTTEVTTKSQRRGFVRIQCRTMRIESAPSLSRLNALKAISSSMNLMAGSMKYQQTVARGFAHGLCFRAPIMPPREQL